MFEDRARAALAGVAACLMAFAAPTARAQDLEARADLRRGLREYLFLNAQLGLRSRQVAYAEDAIEGPGGRSELRFHLNGRYQSAPSGGLGAYVGLGVVGRFPRGDGFADPLQSPYDDFEALQNVRVFGAHVQYSTRDERGRPLFSARAGRLFDLDDRARLLMYDGARAQVYLGRWAVGAYGGRRASLDRDVTDARDDLGLQLVSGVFASARFDTVSVRLSHRFEEVQQAGAQVAWAPTVDLGLSLSGDVVFGGDAALEADTEITGLEPSELPVAVLVRVDADYASPSGRTGAYLVSEVQLGEDPRVYGRAGRGPSEEEIDAATRSAMTEARLDRLFLGPRQPHVMAEVGVEHWVLPVLGFRAGGFARIPIGDAAQRSLQPRILEGWAGPELASARGDRVAVQARIAVEDPGEPGRVFSFQGDGERTFGVLRAFGEVPFRLSDDWVFALRPELEGTVWTTEGPLSRAEDQLAGFGGIMATVRSGPDFRAAVRYGAGTQPSFTSEGVALIHDLELWVGGAF